MVPMDMTSNELINHLSLGKQPDEGTLRCIQFYDITRIAKLVVRYLKWNSIVRLLIFLALLKCCNKIKKKLFPTNFILSAP